MWRLVIVRKLTQETHVPVGSRVVALLASAVTLLGVIWNRLSPPAIASSE